MFACRIAASLPGPTFKDFVRQGLGALREGADLLEFRLDCCKEETDLGQLALTFPRYEKIITVRNRKEAGEEDREGFYDNEEQRIDLLQNAIDHGFSFVDIELTIVHQIKRNSSATKLIVSYHNYHKTAGLDYLLPVYIEAVRSGANIVKITTYARRWEDNLLMFDLLRQAKSDGKPLIAFCMGKKGVFSRDYAPFLGSPIAYASLDNNLTTAPEQPTIKQLRERWNALEHSSHQLSSKPRESDPINLAACIA